MLCLQKNKMVELICYNIEYCQGFKGKWYEYLNLFKTFFFVPKGLDERIIAALKDLNPDILGLVEVDTGSVRAKGKDEARFFRDGLEMKGFDEAVKYDKKGYRMIYNWIPVVRKQSIALLSKFKIENIKHHILHRGIKNIVIEATVHCPKKVTILLAHLALGRKARRKQLYELATIVNGIENPVILMGDFNTFKGESEIDEILARTRLKYKSKLNNNVEAYTQPTFKPSRVLDYVLTSNKIKINKYQVLNMPFSDHLPLLVDFDVVE